MKSELSSLDFVINRFFMKMFNTNDMHIVKNCQMYFNFDMPSIYFDQTMRTLCDFAVLIVKLPCFTLLQFI